MPTILRELFQQDPEAALAWTEGIDDIAAKDKILGDTATMIVAKEPELVITLARRIPDFDRGLSSA